MNPATPPLGDLAARLLAKEMHTGKDPNEPAAARVCGRLGALLSKLAGAAGYCSLLSRALALAQAEAPELRTLQVLPDGQLHGFNEATIGSDTTRPEHSEAVLVAHLLALLYTFIGEPLTFRLVEEAWPSITHDHTSDSPTP